MRGRRSADEQSAHRAGDARVTHDLTTRAARELRADRARGAGRADGRRPPPPACGGARPRPAAASSAASTGAAVIEPGNVAPTPRTVDGVDYIEGRDLTLIYEGKKCIHSRFCVTWGPKVFIANVKGPWINPDAMPTDALAEIAHVCVSGAIRYKRKDGKPDEPTPPVNLISVRENGPYAFRADIRLDGAPAVSYRLTLCRCGASKNKPFCDGSHNEIKFSASGEPPTGKADMLAVRDGPLAIDPQVDGPLRFAATWRSSAALAAWSRDWSRRPYVAAARATTSRSATAATRASGSSPDLATATLLRTDRLHLMADKVGRGAEMPPVAAKLADYEQRLQWNLKPASGWHERRTGKFSRVLEPRNEAAPEMRMTVDVAFLIPELGQESARSPNICRSSIAIGGSPRAPSRSNDSPGSRRRVLTRIDSLARRASTISFSSRSATIRSRACLPSRFRATSRSSTRACAARSSRCSRAATCCSAATPGSSKNKSVPDLKKLSRS